MTSRELAVTMWGLIMIVAVLLMTIKNKKLKKSVKGLFSTFLNLFRNFIMQFLATYTLIILGLFLYLFYKWNFDVITTFLVFTITTYIPIIPNITLSDKSSFKAKKYFKQTFSVAVLGATLVTVYTFSFLIEFILIVPLLLILGMLKGYSESIKKGGSFENIINNLISFVGIVMLINWSIQFTKNLSDILTLDFWISFTVDFWGILVYIPAILILPYFLAVDRKIRFFTKYSNRDYIKLYIDFWKLSRRYRNRNEVTTFDIYKLKLDSKPFHVFSIYGEVDKEVDLAKINYDVQTYCLKLRSGNFDEFDKLENSQELTEHNLNFYADVIYFYFSIKGEKRYYPWDKMYLWRNPRLSQRYMSVKVKWDELDDNLLVKPMD